MAVKATAEVTIMDETDASSLVMWYYSTTSATKPSKPTTTSASATPSGWSKTEPTISSDSDLTKYVYTSLQLVWGDGSCSWGDVSTSAAFEAAKRAYNQGKAASDKVDGMQIGGDNLVGNFNKIGITNAVYNYLSGTLTSTTTTNTRDNAVYMQVYNGGTYVRLVGELGSASKVGQVIHITFEKASDFNRIMLKFNGNKADASVTWDISSVVDGTQLTLSCKLDSISSDGKGNGGVLSGINLRKSNVASQWSLAPKDDEIGGRNLLKSSDAVNTPANYNAYELYLSEPIEDGVPYIIQLWDVDVLHAGKTAATLGVNVYYCGSSVSFGGWIGTSYFTGGHADYLKLEFTAYTSGATVSSGGSVDPSPTNALSHTTVVNATKKYIRLYNSVPYANGTRNLTVGKWKLEKGNKPTDWAPAPEDVDAGISDAAKTATNYITADSSGIRIASANPATATTYQHQTASSTEYYVGGRLRNRIDANGQQVFASDGTTPVAKFGNASGTTMSVIASDVPATGTAYTLPSNVSTITAVMLDGTTLTSGTDYTLDGTTSVTLKASSTVTSILSDSSSSGEDDSEDSSLSGHSLVVEYKCADGAALALGGDLSISGLDSQIPALFRYGAPIQVEHATDGSDAGMNVKRTDTGTGVFFGVGKAGVNHGVFSRLLNRWLLYGDGSRVRVAPHTVTNGAIRMENTSAPTSTPSANWYSPALWFADKLNANFGGIRAAFTSNNRRGVNVWASRVVNNAKKSFGLLLTIDSSGNYHATLGGIGVFTTHGVVNGDQSVTTAANSYKDFTVSFGHTYSSAPNVVVGFYSTSTASGFGGLSCAVNSKTTTGCTIRVFNNTSTGRAPGVEWIAIGD